MDMTNDIAEFLTSGRARITPEQAGLPTYGKRPALHAPLFESRVQPANSARFTFLDPAAVDFYLDRERVATDLVAHLRSEAGRNPYDRGLSDLVGELSTRSDEFRTRWAANNVRAHRAGIKVFNHSLIGRVALPAETMTINSGAELTITVFAPQPGSPEHDALRLLASWNADTVTTDGQSHHN